LGLLSLEEALRRAREKNLDLIEVSPSAVPPIAKIMDYGKFQYDVAKKVKEVKSKSKTTETKTLQVKLGTGENDLEIKAKQASGWLKDGHRVQFNLYLKGREKYLEENFLKSRLERVMKLLTEDFKIAEEIKKNQKGGFSVAIERKK
jgi:translation initiation factor IF-3